MGEGNANPPPGGVTMSTNDQTLRSHYFAASGEILEYTYQLDGDTLTIWFGGTDSPGQVRRHLRRH
jgi:hypothetical protein